MLRYAITDRTLFPSDAPGGPHQELVARCAALAQNGLDLLLIREKDLPAGALADLSREILDTVRQANPHTKVLIASRADIALAARLDGVHLASHPSELTPTQVRTLYSAAGCPAPYVSVSCHNVTDVRHALGHHPSVILFAPVFGKIVAGTQVSPPTGLEVLHQACKMAAATPVLALGGVTSENTQACLEAGAAGIAGIRLFMAPPRAPSKLTQTAADARYP